jgi:hypothetical protein
MVVLAVSSLEVPWNALDIRSSCDSAKESEDGVGEGDDAGSGCRRFHEEVVESMLVRVGTAEVR